jgi:hypothetical protein
MLKIKYIDVRPIKIPKLEKYPNGVFLPNEINNKMNIIEVNEQEASSLLKRKNGKFQKCFELVKENIRQSKGKENIGGEI